MEFVQNSPLNVAVSVRCSARAHYRHPMKPIGFRIEPEVLTLAHGSEESGIHSRAPARRRD
jgi:hypothetical protein